MKVSQLIKELENCNPDDEAVIPVTDSRHLGEEPNVKVGFISRGFDWDDGKVFIRPVGRIKLKSV